MVQTLPVDRNGDPYRPDDGGCVCRLDDTGTEVLMPCGHHAPAHYATRPYRGAHGSFTTGRRDGAQGWLVTLTDGRQRFTYLTALAMRLAEAGGVDDTDEQFVHPVTPQR